MLEQFEYYDQTGKKTVKTIPCFLDNCYGKCAAAGYLQIHDTAAEPSASRVPEAEFYMAAAGNFPAFFSTPTGTLELKTGLTFVISSTSGTYTASSVHFDIWGAVECTDLSWTVTGLTTTGPTGSTNALTIWNTAVTTGPRLFDITVINGEAFTVYPMLFTRSSYLELDVPYWVYIPGVAAGATKQIGFGIGGLYMRSLKLAAGAYTETKGCYLVMSSVASVLTTSAATAVCTLTGRYKTAS